MVISTVYFTVYWCNNCVAHYNDSMGKIIREISFSLENLKQLNFQAFSTFINYFSKKKLVQLIWFSPFNSTLFLFKDDNSIRKHSLTTKLSFEELILREMRGSDNGTSCSLKQIAYISDKSKDEEYTFM